MVFVILTIEKYPNKLKILRRIFNDSTEDSFIFWEDQISINVKGVITRSIREK